MSLLVLFLMCFYNPLASVGDVYEDALRSGDVIFTGLTLPIHHNFKSGLLKKRFDFLNRKLIFSAEIRKSDSLTFQAYGLAHFDLGDNFGVVIEPLLKIGDSKEWPYVVWKKGITAHYSRAYLYYQNKGFFSYIGRNRISMNLGTLMADNDPPFDHFLVKRSSKHFQGFWFFGEFDPITPRDSLRDYPDTLNWWYIGNKTYRRFISAHGIEARIKRFSFGFTEIALFYNAQNFPNLIYLNPIMLYYPVVWDLGKARESEQNIFWVTYFNYFKDNYSFHFEFVVDDFQLEKEGVYLPNRFAWSILLNMCDLVFPNSLLSLEYSGAFRWTFNHRIYLLKWVNRGELMGKLSDVDQDEIKVSLNRFFDGILLGNSFGCRRKGPGTISEHDPFFTHFSYPRESLLSHIEHLELFNKAFFVRFSNKKTLQRAFVEVVYLKKDSSVSSFFKLGGGLELTFMF